MRKGPETKREGFDGGCEKGRVGVVAVRTRKEEEGIN